MTVACIACGTGGWSGPLPGDPDDNLTLSAAPVFGGILVSWSYPALNAYAVAHVLVYAGLSADFGSAVQIGVASGSSYLDRRDDAVLHYYWIQTVSVNGTLGQRIGPATALPKPIVADLIERLTGMIDDGVLAQSLKTSIDRISVLNADLAAEIVSREDGHTTLAQAIQDAQDGSAQALTFIQQEITSRSDADSAAAAALSATAATLGGNIAAVQTATNAQVSRLDGRIDTNASQITQVATQAGTNLAAAQTTLQTNINTVDGKVTGIGARYTVNLTANGLAGGFGVYNDGTSVEAGFDVDTFWVGKTNANKRKPFIIFNGVTYIDTAMIRDATIDVAKIVDATITTAKIANGAITNAKISGTISSDNWNGTGAAGWAIDKNGFAWFNNVTVRGDILATSLTANIVTTNHIQANTIQTNQIQTGEQVTAARYVDAYNAITQTQENFWTGGLTTSAINTKGAPIMVDFDAIVSPINDGSGREVMVLFQCDGQGWYLGNISQMPRSFAQDNNAHIYTLTFSRFDVLKARWMKIQGFIR